MLVRPDGLHFHQFRDNHRDMVLAHVPAVLIAADDERHRVVALVNHGHGRRIDVGHETGQSAILPVEQKAVRSQCDRIVQPVLGDIVGQIA